MSNLRDRAEIFLSQIKGLNYQETDKVHGLFDLSERQIGETGGQYLRWLGGGRFEVKEKVSFPEGASLAQWKKRGITHRAFFEEGGKVHVTPRMGNVSALLVDGGFMSTPKTLVTEWTKIAREINF